MKHKHFKMPFNYTGFCTGLCINNQKTIFSSQVNLCIYSNNNEDSQKLRTWFEVLKCYKRTAKDSGMLYYIKL